MDFIDNFFEVEWIEVENDENGRKKEVVYKEDFGTFNDALNFYLKKKEESTYVVRLISILMESNNQKD